MRATASPVEGNRVRLSVEMDEDEVDQAVRQTARRLAGELRVPGFRPGKVPRQVLEARLGGSSVLREQAIRDALPDMYAQAVVDTEVDPIAAPDIDIVSGADKGAVAFDAVVEVRPIRRDSGLRGTGRDVAVDRGDRRGRRRSGRQVARAVRRACRASTGPRATAIT